MAEIHGVHLGVINHGRWRCVKYLYGMQEGTEKTAVKSVSYRELQHCFYCYGNWN